MTRRTSTPAFLFVALALAAAAPCAPAREVALDVRFAPALVRAVLLERTFTGPQASFAAWRDTSGCNHLVLRDPRVDVHGDRLRVTAAGDARVATPVGGNCIELVRWRGFVQTEHAPEVLAPRTRVRLRVADSRLLDEAGQPAVLAGTIWDWVKTHVHARLDAVELDLAPALDNLRAVLPLVLAGDSAARARAVVDSAAIDLAGVDDAGIVLVLRLDVPEVPGAAAPVPEPVLSARELAAWDAAWRRWDAFLTFVVKHAASEAGAAPLRAALRDVLIEARFDIATVLAGPDSPDRDPDRIVRALFERTWSRLAPVLRDIEARLPGETALRYLAFVTAGDALRAIDALGPGAGLDLSADGLRRLARIVAPGARGDPLQRDEAVDAELRRALGFGEPLPEPGLPDDGGAMLPGWLRAVLPRAAHAGNEDGGDLAARLAGWVATRANLDDYLPLARRLLDATARTAAAAHPVPPAHRREYRDALLATAWQESCWRQFVFEDGAVRALRSPAGAIGIMQVNETVWRGFYSRDRLTDHIGYNARAGAEILAHYLVDHALAQGAGGAGEPHELVRVAYAAYHGGPAAARRFREGKASALARAVDAAFAAKLARFHGGDDLAVAACFVGERSGG